MPHASTRHNSMQLYGKLMNQMVCAIPHSGYNNKSVTICICTCCSVLLTKVYCTGHNRCVVCVAREGMVAMPCRCGMPWRMTVKSAVYLEKGSSSTGNEILFLLIVSTENTDLMLLPM